MVLDGVFEMFEFLKNLFKPKIDENNGLFSERHKFIEDQQALSTPWAMFEVVGFEDDGRIKVEFNWNQAFIEHLDTLGFTAESEEDTVQLFFYTSQMRPTNIGQAVEDDEDDLPVNEDLPMLSDPNNRVMR